MEKTFYSSVTEQLNRAATRAVLGLRGFRSDSLREHLRSMLEGAPGAPNALLADLVFEATFGWHTADATLGGLAGKLLNAKLVNAMRNPPRGLAEDYSFPARRKPYLHQLQAWRELIEQAPPRSVLVSSGTGSGKTECFLVPILNDLANELSTKSGPLVGVRAIFLYPLNALIKSQRDRLIAWSEPFGGEIRYCLYNGDTAEERRMEWQSEVPGRRKLRASPPPILVTNATMLEYMLVRDADRPIIEQSKGKLRWIVIDEAHTYIGSQAAELTLMLRRVLHAFGCSPDEVHFVATSATITDQSQNETGQLREFLADIAGAPIERVSVVLGQRKVPLLPDIASAAPGEALDIEGLRRLSPEQLFEALAARPKIRKMRAALILRASPLSKLSRLVYGDAGERSLKKTLSLLDLCILAKNPKGIPFLPLRGHIFQRAISGIWACANNACPGRSGTHLDREDWTFGKIFLERRTVCDACNCPVFELVQCGECGAEHLSAHEVFKDGRERLIQTIYPQDEDEFQQELEPLEEEDTEEEEEPQEPEQGLPRLIVARDAGSPVGLLQDGFLDWGLENGWIINLAPPDSENRLVCPNCQKPEQQGRLFRPVRIGAPFLLQTAIPTLMEHLPPFRNGQEPLPLSGRRLLGFTDSRQGTARFAAKIQLDTERNFVRSLLYHTVADRARPADPGKIRKLREEIAALEKALESQPILKDLIDEKRRELARIESPPLGRLKWHEATDRLLSNDGFKRWLLPPLQDQTFGLNDRQLAELCLMREFLFRPKRQFSMEGLGLLKLEYPEMENRDILPAVAAKRGITKQEWRTLVQIALDFLIRGKMSVAVPRDILRWMGYPGAPSFILAPGQSKTQRNQQRWPSVENAITQRAQLVQLLACAEGLDLDVREDRSIVAELLFALWKAVLPLLSRTETGFQLELNQQAEIVQVRDAWFCPVTRRVLPVVYKRITPYLPLNTSRNFAECQKIQMPILPSPFWSEAGPVAAKQWLESDVIIANLRKIGVWTDLSDRIASFSDYFRSAEHSAQIAGPTLSRRESEFKSGKLNLLNCSTTMELGVDIGGLTAVAMNNVPPHPANFLQRAGRAGRRSETAALSFVLCKSTPHGEAVFRNPLWAFTTRLAVPRVSLQSAPIVQRHLNALALTVFLSQRRSNDVFKLNCGWFFEGATAGLSANWKKFHQWCQTEACLDAELADGIHNLTKRTALSGRPIAHLLHVTAERLEQTARIWLDECQCLLDNLDVVKTREGNSRAEKAVNFQLERIRREYLLGELAARGFLPIHGFPSGVVSLVTTTAEEFARRMRRSNEFREDNRAVRAGYPARALPIAIRDYAPGTDTVLDGRVYRSDGVTLNWQIPAEAEGPPEIQALRWVWRCNACGRTGTRHTRPSACPHCGESHEQRLTRYEYIQPAGFAVDIRCNPHNDISKPQYIPVRDPLISLEGTDWLALPNPALGRYRVSSNGTLFHRTDGLHGKGFALCLRCGRADSMLADGSLPKKFAENGQPVSHKRLRGGKNNDREIECPGSNESWAIKQNLRIGSSIRTEILELRLRDFEGKPIDRITAYSLNIALRRALAQRIGIEEREIGVAVTSTRDLEGQSIFSMHLYDTAQGGAGYVSQAVRWLPELFRKARSVVECPRNCDTACQGCLLTYDTQYHVDELDRKAVLSLLNNSYLNAFELPGSLRIFGEATLLEMEPLMLALRRELQNLDAKEIRLYLGGTAENWEPLAWQLRDELARLQRAGYTICIAIPSEILNKLDPAQRGELSVLAKLSGAKVYITESLQTISSGENRIFSAMEIWADGESIRWAATREAGIIPGPHWGSGIEESQFIRVHKHEPLTAVPKAWKLITPDEVRAPENEAFSIEISSQLDGPVKSFGTLAWDMLSDKLDLLRKRLAGSKPIIGVHYTDRYLYSPIMIMLLWRLLGALNEYEGGINGQTSVVIRTGKIIRKYSGEPRLIYHDWRDAVDRRRVFELLFSSLGTLKYQELDRHALPHARELRLIWGKGIIWKIRFDQGVGYWHAVKDHEPFPFDRPPETQVDFMQESNLIVCAESQKHSTIVYLSPSNQTLF